MSRKVNWVCAKRWGLNNIRNGPRAWCTSAVCIPWTQSSDEFFTLTYTSNRFIRRTRGFAQMIFSDFYSSNKIKNKNPKFSRSKDSNHKKLPCTRNENKWNQFEIICIWPICHISLKNIKCIHLNFKLISQLCLRQICNAT